ncbi:MAG: sigma-54 dependent transcriptional regulator [candidate division KSB1 bacterium]|nr:sigma-54 dependent transcriptional regulator [candidate division KSB1 bacterium]MDZ7276410.1 sigma-54 dependent transcriptional regulator [candidate division KSB1 bacterium]MDZ7288081.1 sigma-54 dependent transcriptional regulator [candidate division KSB1 bacterium]MDZ7300181.1 sigma-54 dependent transcriptional regulator [candidate division KSB1 bacterium]MDZ7305753.1 sigma-54 dependent transcriptional regulator [candidate division KSB1 bacterium]
MNDYRVLIVDDEARMCAVLKAALEPEGYAVTTATSGTAAINALDTHAFDLVLTDLRMEGPDGLQVLDFVKRRHPACDVILMTAYATAQTAVEAMKRGAYDYIIKPFELDELKLRIRRLAASRALAEENRSLKRELRQRYSVENMIGRSGAMQEVYKMIHKVAPSDATVLIRGESGTGKELVAQAIHYLSPRADKPFVTINCAALPENLLESELFGYEKGAFTGADKRKPGLFEVAGEGTIFLDEIGEISPAIQVKLLRALQNRQIIHLGGTEPITIRSRTIAATNRDLEAGLKSGMIREDFYYRINVFPITIPALRRRLEDLPDLVGHFLTRAGRKPAAITPEAMEKLRLYSWPGNVRELENVIERALIMAGGQPISIADLPPHIQGVQKLPTAFDIPEEGINLEDMERRLLHRAIEKAGGNKSRAAKLLGITRRKLYSMLERLG